jgi:putative ABC transport system permease protein
LGSNLLMVSPGKRMGPGQTSGAPAFKVADAEAIARDIPAIAAVAPTATRSTTAIYANENWATTVTGTREQYFAINNRRVREGRSFTASEARLGAAVCVIGETVRTKLFGRQSPIGNKIRLQKLSCEVIGLIEAKGQSTMGTDQDDLIVIPLRTCHRRIAGNEDVNIIQVSVKDGVSTERVKREIGRLMRIRRHLSSNQDDNFNVMDLKEIATMLSGTTRMMTALLGAVAAVSLLVGGIGIMNIMLVSVTERTREIGIRLAVGAHGSDVMTQFLVESTVMALTGGAIGIAVGFAGARILGHFTGWSTVVSPPTVFLALAFSAAVGIFFGFYPARKAAKLNPIDALRYE